VLELDLWLSVDVLAAIEATAEAKYPFETGGVLVGYRSGLSQIIESAIGPGPNAIRERYSFHSDHEWQCDKLDELFLQSNGRRVYLGEWHTHPGGDCRMSMVDRRTLAKIRRTKQASAPDAFMVIGAGRPGAWSWMAHHFGSQPMFGGFSKLHSMNMKLFRVATGPPSALN